MSTNLLIFKNDFHAGHVESKRWNTGVTFLFLKTMDLLLIEINFKLFVKNEVKLPCRLFHGCSERLGGTRTPDTGLLLSNNQYAAASCRLE